MRALRKTRIWPAPLFLGAALLASGCGGDDFENERRPSVPIELTGVIQDRGVTVSPKKEGAGPFVITISNQTDEAHTVTLEGSANSTVEERVGPIQPQDTATIQRTLPEGKYQVRAGSEQAVEKEIPPAELDIGPDRKSSNDELLLP
jgi:hypothetical protein